MPSRYSSGWRCHKHSAPCCPVATVKQHHHHNMASCSTRRARAAPNQPPQVSINLPTRLSCSIIVILVLLAGCFCNSARATYSQAESGGSSDITIADSAAYCYQRASSSGGSSGHVKNVTWTPAPADSDSSDESPYDKLQRQQAELCRQGKVGAPGQLVDGCSMWRFKYIDEQKPSGFEVKILDESLDERLANIVYTALSIKPVVPDFFKVGGDDDDSDVVERNLRSLEGPQVDGQRCQWQLSQMVAQLDELEARLKVKRQNASFKLGLDERHIRLARALDSYGRYDSGLFLGKFHSLGSFSECKSNRLLLPVMKSADEEADTSDHELVKNRFCWARMDLGKHMNASLKARKTDSYEVSEHVFQLGVCLPDSCHTRHFLKPGGSVDMVESMRAEVEHNRRLLQRLIDSQFKLPQSLYIDETLEMKYIYCLADEGSQYRVPLSGKLALAFVAGWFLVAVYATYYKEFRRNHWRASNKKNDDDDDRKELSAIDAIGGAGNFFDQHKWAQDVLDCFNIKKSWQDFMGEEYDDAKCAIATNSGAEQTSIVDADSVKQQQQQPQRQPLECSQMINLDTLNPIKVIGCMYVVLGHALIVMTVFSMDSLIVFNRLETDPIAVAMLIGTLIVDTFFVITGIIMGYIAMSKAARLSSKRVPPSNLNSNDKTGKTAAAAAVEALKSEGNSDAPVASTSSKMPKAVSTNRRQPLAIVFLKHWFHNVMSRYLRLVPLFFLAYWLKRSFLIYYLSYGQPYMDNGFNKVTQFGACKRESWWTPFNMMTAFLPLSQQCLPQAWSIASDLLFTITVTPIVLIMTRRPKLALILGSATCFVSWAWAFKSHLWLESHKGLDIIHLRGHGVSAMFGSVSQLYTHPHLRFSSILVGVLAGYLVHKYEIGDMPQWSHWLRNWATKMSFLQFVGLALSAAYVNEIKPLAAGYERFVFANLLTTGRIFWVMANGIIFLRMVTDWRNNFLMRQFSNKFWTTMVRLNLAILVLHMDVLIYQVSSATVADNFSYRSMISLFGATYVVCVPLAVFIHIIYDNPIYKLTKRYALSHI